MKGKQKHSKPKKINSKYTDSRDDEIAELEERIASDEIPKSGHVPPLGQKVEFSTLPISAPTLQGLTEGVGGGSKNRNENVKNFTIMTDIQNACIPHALAGRDILGAAKTGSGKTLAFLIPLVERLYRNKWTPDDGVGAIVLSPTRELAMQIFDVLRVVGSHHHLSAGLVVGGKTDNLLEEQMRLPRTNIVIATPGRLLQHLEQTPLFDTSNTQVLVLDEADRILDMGFRNQLFTILEYLPKERQTMLFSATQTKNVKDLAVLSLSKPEYIGVHDKDSTATPDQLTQSLMVCPLPHKLDMVFSFIKSHLKCKTLIFFSTCSQVRYIYELFCTLQPGISILSLHGKIKQEKRTQIYFEYLNKPHAVLLATDVAARGLDFPNVDWVLQADAPEDRDAYIHRVGRTARNQSKGKSLLLLLPSEKDGMVQLLQKHAIPIKSLSVNPSKAVSITQRAASIVASRPDLSSLAKKAFSSYLRSMSLMPNKDIFGVNILKDLPVDEYASSLGLPSTPSTRFMKKLQSRDEYRQNKNKNHKLERLKEQIRNEKLKKRIERLGEVHISSDITKSVHAKEEEEDDLLVVKQKHEWSEKDVEDRQVVVDKVRKPKRIRVEGSTGLNNKIIFDDEGKEVPSVLDTAVQNFEENDLGQANEAFLDQIKGRLAMTREQDIAQEKERIRDKKRKRKLLERGLLPLPEEPAQEERKKKSFKQVVEADRENEPSSDSDDSDDDSDDLDTLETNDLAKQEAMALALLEKA